MNDINDIMSDIVHSYYMSEAEGTALLTRMHFSRMPTVHCSGRLMGVSAQGNGVSTRGGGVCPGCTPPCRQTDICENMYAVKTYVCIELFWGWGGAYGVQGFHFNS